MSSKVLLPILVRSLLSDSCEACAERGGRPTCNRAASTINESFVVASFRPARGFSLAGQGLRIPLCHVASEGVSLPTLVALGARGSELVGGAEVAT